MDTGSDMPTTPSEAWNDLGKSWFSQTWRAIMATYFLDCLLDPRKPTNAQDHTGLDRCLARKIKTYSLEEPQVKQEKAVPLRIIHSIITTASF